MRQRCFQVFLITRRWGYNQLLVYLLTICLLVEYSSSLAMGWWTSNVPELQKVTRGREGLAIFVQLKWEGGREGEGGEGEDARWNNAGGSVPHAGVQACLDLHRTANCPGCVAEHLPVADEVNQGCLTHTCRRDTWNYGSKAPSL